MLAYIHLQELIKCNGWLGGILAYLQSECWSMRQGTLGFALFLVCKYTPRIRYLNVFSLDGESSPILCAGRHAPSLCRMDGGRAKYTCTLSSVFNSCRRGTDGPGSQLEAGKVVRIGRCSEICEIDGRVRTDRYTRVPVGVSARGQYQGKVNGRCYIHLCERTARGCVEYHTTCQTNPRGMWIIEINALLVTGIIVDSVPARV